jgi:DNA-binding transcriptional ArsR family regulator
MVMALPRSDLLLEHVAERFQALGDPARLRLLECLRGGECTVSDLVEATGLGQANVSKHLQVLHARRLVKRRKDGLFTWYRLADPEVTRLCDLVCKRVQQEAAAQVF